MSSAGTGGFMRTAGLAGVASAVLLLIGLILAFAQGAPPALDEGAQKIVTYFSDNEGLAKAAAAFNVLPILTLPVFFAGIYMLFSGHETAPGVAGARGTSSAGWPLVALIAFIALGVFSTVQGSAAFAIALGVGDEFGGQPAVAGALFDLYNALGPASSMSMALFLWAVGTCHATTAGWPDWLKPVLYLGAAAAVVSFFAPFLEMDALAFAGLLAFVIFIVWVAVAGLRLMRGVAAATT